MPLRTAICVLAVLLYAVSVRASTRGASWSATIPLAPGGNGNISEAAIGIAHASGDIYFVVTERSQAGSLLRTPVLHKVSASRTAASATTVWSKTVRAASGLTFALALNANRNSVYLLILTPSGAGNAAQAHVVLLSDINGTESNTRNRVQERTIFSTPANAAITKMFDCALNEANGDLYLTGGTLDSLYAPSQGKGDITVVRLSSIGQELAKVQFGSKDEEFGRAIAISADASVVSVAASRVLPDGGIESLMYRLDAQTLRVLGPPRTLPSYGTPLFTVRGVAVSGPGNAPPAALTTFVAGSALAIPNQKNDIYIHAFSNVNGKESDVAVYIDGADDNRQSDSCVSIQAGSDGNAYCLGYTETTELPLSRNLNFAVVSPTGQQLFVSERSTPAGSLEIPVAMILVETNSGLTLAYVGQTEEQGTKIPTIGFVVPPPNVVPIFQGFGDQFKQAQASKSPSPAPTPKTNGSPIAIIGVGAGMGLIVIVVGTAIFMKAQRKKNFNDGPTPRDSRKGKILGGRHVQMSGDEGNVSGTWRDGTLI